MTSCVCMYKFLKYVNQKLKCFKYNSLLSRCETEDHSTIVWYYHVWTTEQWQFQKGEFAVVCG